MKLTEQEQALALDNILSTYCQYDFTDISENTMKLSCSLDVFAKESEHSEAVEFFTDYLKNEKEKIVTYALVRMFDKTKQESK